jgi:hypothetical protein
MSKNVRIKRSVEVDVEVDIDFDPEDLTDEQLLACVAEAEKRMLAVKAFDRDLLADVQQGLMSANPERRERAVAQFEAALLGVTGGDLFDAFAAIRSGQWSLAICLLEKCLYETPAATAKCLPAKVAA